MKAPEKFANLVQTILLVDDDELLRGIFVLALQEQGYVVIESDSGLRGYELAKQHRPDLIITDLEMAEGGGEALLHFIRSDPELFNKQVVLITGNASQATLRRGMEAGADDFLVKPVTLEALVGCVKARLKRAKDNAKHFLGKVARRHEELERFILSARIEMCTPTFLAWARSEFATLAIVFTDIVGFTKLCEELTDSGMKEVRQLHFSRSRELVQRYRGYEVKTIGDSVLAAFRSVQAALNFAVELHRDTGHSLVHIRAAIHFGPMHIEENDVFGGAVNFAGRMVNAIKGSEIWLSDQAKENIDTLEGKDAGVQWLKHEDIPFKGFGGTWTLWSVKNCENEAGNLHP
jgi:class 3 adenylate cyclase/DNA-binding NarL/FixJ family response regulator